MPETWREKANQKLPLWAKRSLATAKGAFDRLAVLDRIFVATRYLRGEGIEIGALASPVHVPPGVKVRYVDRAPTAELRKHFPNVADIHLPEVDIVDDGETLGTIPSGSQDFVIANHFLEHCENTFLALENTFRVLRTSGVLFLALPDMRYTFDKGRAETPIEHIARDYEEGPAWSRRAHYEEWVRVVLNLPGEDAIQLRIQTLMDEKASIHFHAWRQQAMHGLLEAFRARFRLRFDYEFFLKRNDEAIFVLRKQ